MSNELNHILFSLANIESGKLKHVARAIDFILSLDSSSPVSYNQVIANYEAIKTESKWQQYHLTNEELKTFQKQYLKESWVESNALEAIDSYSVSKPVVKVAPEPVKHCCIDCQIAQDIDGKNSYCPEEKRVHNSIEKHPCECFQLKQVKPKKLREQKVKEFIGEDIDESQLKEKAVYDRYYKPKSYTWQNRNTDLVDTEAMYDSSLTRRENNELIRNMGREEYRKDAYAW